jgi:hypothetical protein
MKDCVKSNMVPQGSALGTIIFILYINQICDVCIDGSVVTYADDIYLLYSHHEMEYMKMPIEVSIRYKKLK